MKHQLWSSFISFIFRFSNPKLEERIFLSLIWRRSQSLSPDEGLKYVLDFDNKLYGLTQKASERYGEGVHPKHRLLDFHQYFYNRIEAHERVLDIGSHEGVLTKTIADHTGAQITGIEILAERVEQANRKNPHPNVKYIVGDVTKFIPDEPFDVITMSNVLEHLPERVNFLLKAQQNTGANRFLIRVPRFDRDWRVPLKREVGVDYRLDDEHTIEYTPETFEDEMKQAGLSIVHIESRWGEFWADLRVSE